jgi:hypothetical protein
MPFWKKEKEELTESEEYCKDNKDKINKTEDQCIELSKPYIVNSSNETIEELKEELDELNKIDKEELSNDVNDCVKCIIGPIKLDYKMKGLIAKNYKTNIDYDEIYNNLNEKIDKLNMKKFNIKNLIEKKKAENIEGGKSIKKKRKSKRKTKKTIKSKKSKRKTKKNYKKY